MENSNKPHDFERLYKEFEKLGVYNSPASDRAPLWSKIFVIATRKCAKIMAIKRSDMSVLDVGTGVSISLIGLIKLFKSNDENMEKPILSVDIDSEALRQSKGKLSEKGVSDDSYQHIEADACNLCFPNETFDLIACVLSLHDINKQGYAIHQILNVCKNMGFMVFIDASEEFARQIYKHPDHAKKKGLVKFIKAKHLYMVLREILPTSSISVPKEFQDRGHRVAKTTKYFLVIVRRTDRKIVEIGRLQERLTQEENRLIEEFNTRARLERSRIEKRY